MNANVRVLSTVKVSRSEELYKIVDSLNRTLKEDDLMFGLSRDEGDRAMMVFTIYRT